MKKRSQIGRQLLSLGFDSAGSFLPNILESREISSGFFPFEFRDPTKVGRQLDPELVDGLADVSNVPSDLGEFLLHEGLFEKLSMEEFGGESEGGGGGRGGGIAKGTFLSD